jgi:hypothetical protein
MSVNTKSNLPQNEPLRWNLRKAAIEFKSTPDTLKKTLNQVSASPDENGLYTTAQLVQALFGQLYQERLRVQRETADRIALENQITRGETLNRADLMKGLAQIADAMTYIISTSSLTREEQENLQKELAGVPVVLADTARKQSRLCRAEKGSAEEE